METNAESTSFGTYRLDNYIETQAATAGIKSKVHIIIMHVHFTSVLRNKCLIILVSTQFLCMIHLYYSAKYISLKPSLSFKREMLMHAQSA